MWCWWLALMFFSNDTVGKAPAEVILFPTGSLCVWHDIAVHDEHQLLLQGEEVWNHQLQVRLTASVIQHDGRLFYFVFVFFFKKDLDQSSSTSNLPAFLCRTVNRRDKTKKGKERQNRDRTSKKPASEQGANHSSSQPQETEHLASSDVTESLPPVDKRGPTIPRNTGQRYSNVSSQGAEQRHVTAFSHN